MNTTFNLWVNSTPRSDKSFEIYLRVTQNRNHKSIKTGITILNKSDFNPKAKGSNWIRGKFADAKKLNSQLEEKLTRLKEKYNQLEASTDSPSKERIIQSYTGNASSDFLEFLDRIIQRFQEGGNYRSSRRYGQLRNKLLAFRKDKKLPFDLITVTFLKDFKLSMKDLHQNTVYEHFKNFKASMNQAIEEDVIQAHQSPFGKFKVYTVTTSKEKLTEDEIRLLRELNLEPGSSLWHSLNCFLFAFYCGGIRAGDLIMMRWSNIVDGNLTYVMSKTRNNKLLEKSVPLIPEALEILKHYEHDGLSENDFIFQLLNREYSKFISRERKIKSGYEIKIFNQIGSKNTILNRDLKKIAELAGFSKKVSFHIARHSFAQYALDRDINPKVLQSILGHEKFATTETYINTLKDKKVEDAMLKIFDNG